MAWLMRLLGSFIRRHQQPLYVVLVFVIALYAIAAGYQASYDGRTTKLGVSFSIKYAQELGLNWRQAYLALLDDLEVTELRLMSYWDIIERDNNQYSWEELDWQLDQAQRHNASVTLAIGRRQPRWPECHTPSWAQRLSHDQQQNELLQFISDVADRYKSYDVIKSYQIENEASNNAFGECPDYDPDFLSREIQLVREIDNSKQLITNVSNQSGLPTNGPVEQADRVGLSIYKRAHFPAFGRQWYWSFWYVPSEWHSLRAALIEGLDNKPVFIHELQAEPWGPVATSELTDAEQRQTMDSQKLREIVAFAEQAGTDTIFLWGGEWWYWRLSEFNDKDLWQTVRDIYNESAVL